MDPELLEAKRNGNQRTRGYNTLKRGAAPFP